MAKASMMDLVMKFDKFDGKGNFTLWQTRMKALLVAQGLQKALLGKDKKPADMKDEDWEEIDLKALSIIHLCLADDVMFNVIGAKTTAEIWSKLQGLYMTKSLSTKLYWKKQLYGLHMVEGTSISEHLNSFNRICSEVSGLGETLKEEDKAMILLMSLPSSYGHIVTSLMVGKETLTLDEVQSELLNNEVRQRSNKVEEGHPEAMVARAGRKGKGAGGPCYFCGKAGHLKRDCAHRVEWLKKKQGGSHAGEEGSAGIAEGGDLSNKTVFGEVLLVKANISTSKDNSWILDSGSTVHVCSTKGSFSSFVQKKEGTVRLANGAMCRVRGKGMVSFAGSDGTVHTLEAVYVPNLCVNLVSLGALDKAGCKIQVHNGVMAISKEGREILHGEKCEGLYKLKESSVAGGVGGRFHHAGGVRGRLHQGGAHVKSLEGSPKATEASWTYARESGLDSSAEGYVCRFVSGGGFEILSTHH